CGKFSSLRMLGGRSPARAGSATPRKSQNDRFFRHFSRSRAQNPSRIRVGVILGCSRGARRVARVATEAEGLTTIRSVRAHHAACKKREVLCSTSRRTSRRNRPERKKISRNVLDS